MFSLVLDILVAVLLVITIGYAMALNRRLGSLRRGKEEMENLAASFGEATARAEGSIGKLKNTADRLHESIEKAQALRDDLAFLIDRGNIAADHLEEIVRGARDETGYTPQTAGKKKLEKAAPGDKASPGGEPGGDVRSEAELELLKALQAAR